MTVTNSSLAKSSMPNLMTTAERKETKLRGMMREFGSVLVAYSGGVDSSYLAYISASEIGENSVCVLGISPSVSKFQKESAIEFANEHSFNLKIIETNEIENPNYVANPSNRCFYCKDELYRKLSETAKQIGSFVVLDGTNSDDVKGHRPGHAAARVFGVRSPLADLGFTKAEIRERSKAHNLKTWDSPSSPCLASRIQYSVPVTIERLSKVERAEEIIREFGFSEFRVRDHGGLARIELSATELSRIFDVKFLRTLAANIKKTGFDYVTLDLEGFRSGSMNTQTKIGDKD